MKKVITKVKRFFGLDTEFEETFEESTQNPVEQVPNNEEVPKQKRAHLQSVPQPVQEKPVQQAAPRKQKEFRFPLIKDEEKESITKDDLVQNRSERVEKKSAVFEDHNESSTLHLPKHLSSNSQVYDVEVSGIRDLLEKRNRSHGVTNVVRLQRDTAPARKTRNVTRDEAVFLTDKPARQDVVEKNENPAFINPLENKKRFVPTHVPSPVHGFKEPKPIKELLKDEFDAKLTIPVVFQAEEVVPADSKQMVHNRDDAYNEQVEPFVYSESTNKQAQNNQIVEQEVAVTSIEEEQLVQQEYPLQDATESKSAPVEQVTAKQDTNKLDDLQLQNLTIENSTVHIGQIHVEPAQTVIVKEQIVTTDEQQVEAPVTSQAAPQQQNISGEISVENEPVQKTSGSKIPFNVLMLSSDKNKMKGNPFQQIKSGVPATITEKVELRREAQQQADDTHIPAMGSEEEKSEPLEDRQEQLLTESTYNNQIQVTEQAEFHTAASSDEASKHISQSAVAVLERESELAEEQLIPHASTPQQVIDLLQAAEAEESTSVFISDVQYSKQVTETVDDQEHQVSMQPEQQNEQQQVRMQLEQQEFEQSQQPQAMQAEQKQVDMQSKVVQGQPLDSYSDPQLASTNTTSEVKSGMHEQSATTMLSTEEVEEVEVPPVAKPVKPYQKPSLDILVPPEEKTEDWAWMDEQADYLIAALASHQINAQIESIVQGPAVTQFEITVAAGTKVSKVRNLSDDIKLALAAKDIRIDAPIPGKRTIGIEIPNRISRAVRLSEVTDSEVFQNSDSPLEAALGLDLNGKPVTIDLRKMPHGLIAGATGSGKSVCINSILVSLLYKADPHELKLMLIDPKMVELAPFNKIPHLVSPVITDVKAATAALKWAVEEMENRYQLFMHAGVRDITRYNSQAEKAGQHAQKMPYILIVIDELADLMMMSPADVEEAICRIAQKARACGIHLIVATQRPSVDVITGLIKSNIPTRIAFAVSSAIDSRTILDGTGAERLLGRGDMLYLGNGMPAPIRLQGTFVTDDEIEEIIDYVRSQGEPNYFFAHEDLLKKAEFVEEQDELFEEVCRYVFEVGTASTSSIQRRYHIGYNRAARLVDMLEGHGFVSEQRGSKPREVFITEADLENLFS